MTGRHCRTVSFGIAAGVVLAALAGCSAPSARLAGVGMKDIDLQSVTVVFDVELTNPNASALPLADVDYELSSRPKSKSDEPLTRRTPDRIVSPRNVSPRIDT